MLQPKKTKFRRQQKGRMKGNAHRGTELSFGSFGIKTLESAWLTGQQIEAARQAVVRYMKREGKIWIRVFPDKPYTKHSVLEHRNFPLPPSSWSAEIMLNSNKPEEKK